MADYFIVEDGVVDTIRNIVGYSSIPPDQDVDGMWHVPVSYAPGLTVGDPLDLTVYQNVRERLRAQALMDTDTLKEGKALRALAQLVVQEINVLRQQPVWVNAVGTLAWDPASMANGAGVTSPGITVTGAQFGDFVDVAAPYSLVGITATAYVSAANTVVIRLQNGTGGAVNLAAGDWRVALSRRNVLADRTLAQARAAYGTIMAAGGVDS